MTAVPQPLAWGTTWPRLEGFRELAGDRRVVPVVRRLLADEVTPVGLYRTLAQGRPGTFVLESAEVDGTWSRYSFVGVRSRATLSVAEGRAVWTGDVPVGVPTEGDVLEVLAATLEALRTPALEGLPPLTGGLVGAMGWDIVRHWEPTLPAMAPDELGVPEVTLCLASDLAVVDHVDGTVWLVANAINFDDTDQRVDEAYLDAVARLDAMQADLVRGEPVAPGVLVDGEEPELEFRSTQEEFERIVLQGKEAIREGEVFQVVLSQRLDLECSASPLDVYRTLRTINPSQYMYYLQLEDPSGREFAVVGSSPETLVKLTGDRVVTYPIAGSRPRGADVEQDAAYIADLLADPKELAEHVMLVDLSRNDLVKVCEPTTIEVVEFMAARRFSHVIHLCSTVTGRLRAGATALETLKATFPAGTLSGAPKPRAIALIDELEPARRGIYGGTVGYFDFAGDMDMAIAIRTAMIREGRASVQAGAGIVADSVPASEYAEARNKAAAAVRAVQIASRLRRAGS
ncbi:anthranilate synthase component I [Actinotalea sp.]|uniref:anthranilate synthase component I n=1 Tax=Actinotalea sp. TaxID=1872145 RepID=UPI0035654C81